jgi:hypothetical protein
MFEDKQDCRDISDSTTLGRGVLRPERRIKYRVFRETDNVRAGKSQLRSQSMSRRTTSRASSSTTCLSVHRLVQRLRTDGQETT